MPTLRSPVRLTILFLGLCAFLSGTANADPMYVITPLTPGVAIGSPNTPFAYAINNAGQVVGRDVTTSGMPVGFLYSNGQTTQLANAGSGDSQAFSISDSGVIVGDGDTTAADSPHGGATLYEWNVSNPNAVIDLGPQIFAHGSIQSMLGFTHASSINTLTIWASPGLNNYFYSINTDQLTQLPSTFTPAGANASNIIAGENNNVPGYYTSGTFTPITISGVGDANAINDLGQIVGYGSAAGGYIYNIQSNSATFIPFTPFGLSTPSDPNSVEAVGGSFAYQNGHTWDIGSDLVNGAGWSGIDAFGVNSSGQIVGSATFNGDTVAFVATPAPEPSTLALLGIGAIGSVIMARRRRGQRTAP